MAKIQLWVDVEALNKALLETPLTASTIVPIYKAIGLFQGSSIDDLNQTETLEGQLLGHVNPCSDSRAPRQT